jgi:hypothetical protein
MCPFSAGQAGDSGAQYSNFPGDNGIKFKPYHTHGNFRENTQPRDQPSAGYTKIDYNLKVPNNPYTRAPGNQGNNSSSIQGEDNLSLDQAINLKRGARRAQVHRYDLRIKIKSTKTEDDEYEAVEKAIQKFLDIALQADASSIIPPFYALDRNDKTVPDFNSSFQVNALDSLPSIK